MGKIKLLNDCDISTFNNVLLRQYIYILDFTHLSMKKKQEKYTVLYNKLCHFNNSHIQLNLI